MPGLTTLGIVHTAISLVAVAAGIVELVRRKEIGAIAQALRIRAEPKPALARAGR